MEDKEIAGRILFISPHVDGYGADRSMLNNLIELKRKGYDILLLIPSSGLLENYLKAACIPYLVKPFKSWTKGKGHFVLNMLKGIFRMLFNLIQACHLSFLLRKDDIRIVHTNDLITPIGMMIAKMMGARHIMHSRALHFEQFGIRFDLGEKYALQIINWYSDFLICNSTAVHERYEPYFNKSKITIINSAIFFREKLALKNYRTSYKQVNFLFVGRYEASKDPLSAIKSSHQLLLDGYSNFQINFFGQETPYSIDYYRSMTEFVAKNNLRHQVVLNGFDEHISTKMEQYDVAVFCSPIEGIARVIVEYMTNGLPVIGTNSGSTPELITDGVTGFLYEPLNYRMLTEKMKLFLTDPSLISRMGKEAFYSVGRNFSAEYTTEQLQAVYLSVLQNHRLPSGSAANIQ
jgi:glycosyltransferase involved in cell wall biosynthesis